MFGDIATIIRMKDEFSSLSTIIKSNMQKSKHRKIDVKILIYTNRNGHGNSLTEVIDNIKFKYSKCSKLRMDTYNIFYDEDELFSAYEHNNILILEHELYDMKCGEKYVNDYLADMDFHEVIVMLDMNSNRANLKSINNLLKHIKRRKLVRIFYYPYTGPNLSTNLSDLRNMSKHEIYTLGYQYDEIDGDVDFIGWSRCIENIRYDNLCKVNLGAAMRLLDGCGYYVLFLD